MSDPKALLRHSHAPFVASFSPNGQRTQKSNQIHNIDAHRSTNIGVRRARPSRRSQKIEWCLAGRALAEHKRDITPFQPEITSNDPQVSSNIPPVWKLLGYHANLFSIFRRQNQFSLTLNSLSIPHFRPGSRRCGYS